MSHCRADLPNRCCHLTSRVARRVFEGGQAANRKGRAAMTRDDYCGNLLWQSGLTLFAPDVVKKKYLEIKAWYDRMEAKGNTNGGWCKFNERTDRQ